MNALQIKEKRAKMEQKKGNELTGQNKPKRDKYGRLLPGYTANPNGRPPDKIINKEAVIESLQGIEKAKNKRFLDHLWERAYKNDQVALEMFRTFVAKKGIDLGKFTGAGHFNVIIQTFSGKEGDKPVNIDITPEQGQQESKE